MKRALSRISIRVKILAALAVDLLLMVALGTFAAFQMGQMYERAQYIEQHTIPQLSTVAQIESVLNRYRNAQLEYMVYVAEGDKNRLEGLMRDLETEMERHFVSYRALQPTAEELEQLTIFEQSWQEFVAANWMIPGGFIIAYREENSGNARPVFTRTNWRFNDLVEASGALASASRNGAAAALNDVRATYDTSRHFILADTMFTLFISAIIGLILSGRIASRLGRLRSATQKVAEGDLERKVVVSSNDELGRLATNFNAMVDSLREQRQVLQERHDELQRSLERQQQLTEDLMRHKASEEAAVRAQVSAEAASEAKSMFLATMSHELRTPLTAILGYAQIMRMTAETAEPDEINGYLDRILAAGRHLTTMINNVLDFSKIEQGKMDLDLTEFSVAAMIDDAISIIAPLMEKNANRFEVDCPPELGTMYGDQGKVRQVLFNLLSNAAKFTNRGQVSLRVQTEMQAGETWFAFHVADTGIGIAADQLDNLFKPFRQVDNSATRKYDGTGLGLALSLNMCELMGGTIQADSEAGVGSHFIVYLPARVGTGMGHSQQRPAVPGETEPANGLAIFATGQSNNERALHEPDIA